MQAVSQGESLMGQLGSFVSQSGLPEATANQLTGLAKLGMGVTSMIAQTVRGWVFVSCAALLLVYLRCLLRAAPCLPPPG